MKLPGDPFRLPPDKRPASNRAKRLEVLTIIFVLSIIGVISAVMGTSQTMKAMWVEDVLSLVPPIAFLIGRRFSDKTPDQQFLYGVPPYSSNRVSECCYSVAGIGPLHPDRLDRETCVRRSPDDPDSRIIRLSYLAWLVDGGGIDLQHHPAAYPRSDEAAAC